MYGCIEVKFIIIAYFGLQVKIKNKTWTQNNDNFNYLKVFVFFCIWQGPTSDRPLPHGTLRSPYSYVVPSKHLQIKKQDNIIIHFQQTLCVCYTLLECQQRPAMRSIFYRVCIYFIWSYLLYCYEKTIPWGPFRINFDVLDLRN